MSTCKFFLQGTCKFGDNCKFSHQINDTGQSHGTSVMRQQSKPPIVDTNLLVKSVVTDMINAEKGGHWLLSSYAPFKDKPCFPGFENRSFEEVRFGYYEAMKNGTVEQYKQQLQIALQEAAMKMKALQNPTNEIVSMLIQIYNTPVKSQNDSTGIFSGSQSNSIFGQNQPSFGQNQTQNTSIFAVANQQLFGNAPNQQQSIFVGPQASAGSSSIFGPPQQNANQSIFGGGQTIFNKQQTFGNTTNNPIFGNHNVSVNNNPFVGQNNTFTTQNSMFSQPNNTFNANANSIFGPQAQTPPFQTQTSSNSPFGNQTQINPIFSAQNQPFSFANAGQTQQQPIFAVNTEQQKINQNILPFQQQQQPSNIGSNVFHTPVTSASVFGGQMSIFNNQSANTEQKLTNSIFGQTSQMNSAFGRGTEVIDHDAYSKLEDLSESDIRSFQSESFELGKIPEKPPTVQMCI